MSEANSQIPFCPDGARLIPLTQGKFAIVDEIDFDRVNRHKWYCTKGYAARTVWRGENKQECKYLHHAILPAPEGMEVDHINSRHVLDNRRSNLRLATHQQNMFNTKLRKDNSSGVKGVWWVERRGTFQVQIKIGSRRIWLGAYQTIEEAAGFRLTAAMEFHGDFVSCF